MRDRLVLHATTRGRAHVSTPLPEKVKPWTAGPVDMRTLSALLICLTLPLALAGCFGGDDEGDGGDGGNTPTTPTSGTAPTNTTPTRPTNTTPTTPTAPTNTTGGNETGGGSPPAPKEAGAGTANFASPSPPAAATVTIDPGYTRVNLTVTWTETAPVSGVLQEISVTFTDSAGAALTCTLPAGPVSPATPISAPCVQEGPVAPGDATVSFAGAGGISAAWTVNVS